MTPAQEALKRLKEGNNRFVERLNKTGAAIDGDGVLILPQEQKPFATILGCSDSRVPAEIVFDQGLGDLFVIRVAGNVVAPSQVGSVEYATSQFGTPLVIVLGHTECGAVAATIEQLQQPAERQSRNLRSIVDRIRPSVEGLLGTELRHDVQKLLRHAVRTNIGVSVSQLRHGSEILEDLIERGELLVVGAEYSLETGVVEFFDDWERGRAAD